MSFVTTDLCDAHPGLRVLSPRLRNFGGRVRFCGEVLALACLDDNSLVRETLQQPGRERVLVVDGQASMECALLGDQLGDLGVRQGWSGIVIWGCVRDTAALSQLDLGVRALAAHPRKSVKRGQGHYPASLWIDGVQVDAGAFLYADEDGIVIAPEPISA